MFNSPHPEQPSAFRDNPQSLVPKLSFGTRFVEKPSFLHHLPLFAAAHRDRGRGTPPVCVAFRSAIAGRRRYHLRRLAPRSIRVRKEGNKTMARSSPRICPLLALEVMALSLRFADLVHRGTLLMRLGNDFDPLLLERVFKIHRCQRCLSSTRRGIAAIDIK